MCKKKHHVWNRWDQVGNVLDCGLSWTDTIMTCECTTNPRRLWPIPHRHNNDDTKMTCQGTANPRKYIGYMHMTHACQTIILHDMGEGSVSHRPQKRVGIGSRLEECH